MLNTGYTHHFKPLQPNQIHGLYQPYLDLRLVPFLDEDGPADLLTEEEELASSSSCITCFKLSTT